MDLLDFKDTTAVVTGGARGIGAATAALLRRCGARAVSLDLSEGCDVTDEAAVEAAVAYAAEPLGGLHIAVVNAGGGAGGPIFTTTLDVWRYVVDVNLTGAFLTVKHAGRAIADAGGGSIVAISSIAGALTHRLMAAYCASKAGLEMLIKVAADELGALGVRANAVRPGLVPTDLSSPLVAEEEIVADYRAQMPLARLGTPDDVAAAVRWLAGPESSWVTGQCFAIDGGHTLRRGPNIDPMIARYGGPDALAALQPRRRES